MSQAGIISTTSGPVPPSVPTSFVTDSGTAVPVANILNVLATDTTANNDEGLQTVGSGNTVTIELTNRARGTVTTSDATLTTILTFPLGATPGTYFFEGKVLAFNASGPNSACYLFQATFLTTGVAATLVDVEYDIIQETAGFATADIFVSASGNNALVQVQGVVGLTINWKLLSEYEKVT